MVLLLLDRGDNVHQQVVEGDATSLVGSFDDVGLPGTRQAAIR
jgi:hypothetical protein